MQGPASGEKHPGPFPGEGRKEGRKEGRCSAFLPLNESPPLPLPTSCQPRVMPVVKEHPQGGPLPEQKGKAYRPRWGRRLLVQPSFPTTPGLKRQGGSVTGANTETLHRLGAGGPLLPVCCPAAGAGCGESLRGGFPTVGGSSFGNASGWKGVQSPARRCWRATSEDEEGTVRPTHRCPSPSPRDPTQNGTHAPKLPAASSTEAQPSSSPLSQALAHPSPLGLDATVPHTHCFQPPSVCKVSGPRGFPGSPGATTSPSNARVQVRSLVREVRCHMYLGQTNKQKVFGPREVCIRRAHVGCCGSGHGCRGHSPSAFCL